MIHARVTDREAIAARSPSELATYLRAQGWTALSRSDTGAQWIKNVDGDEFEAQQPLDRGLRDYAARVMDVLVVLAIVEGLRENIADKVCWWSTTWSASIGRVPARARSASPGPVDGDDRLRRVWMGLPAADYAEATPAHQEMRPVFRPR